MTANADNPTSLSSRVLEEVDRICLDFEQAWLRCERPGLRQFLERGNGPMESSLLYELLLLEIDYRARDGEQPELVEYLAEFPQQSSIVRSAFDAARTETIDERTEQAVVSTRYVPPRDQPTPSCLGRYRVDERLGIGGCGAVYKAYDDQLQRYVAVKVPHREWFGSAAAKEMFLNEARFLATLRHPGIVPVHDVGFTGENDETCFVVSEYMDGGNLAEYAANHRLSAGEVAQIAIRIADALHYAHGKGLVHRDVKLSNIIRDADGNVYIADFGLALRDEDIGKGVGFAGTPANMSPEQARGEGHLVDGRADVYGLGVVLYELLTGKRPLDSTDMTSLMEQIACREPKPLRQIDDQIPIPLEQICLKALSKRPADRYCTAMDMANELRHFQRGRTAPIRTLASSLLPVTVAALAIFWLMVILRGTSTPPIVTAPIRSLAVLPFRTVVEDEQSAYVSLGMADTLITKLSHLRQIIVRPTSDIREYQRQTVDPVAAGQALRVDAVLEGTIQQSAGQTRTSVRLLSVADGKSLWAETFDEDSVDLFSVQALISAQVARALVLQLTNEEQHRLEHRHTENRQAYEAYTKGRYYWNQRPIDGPSAILKGIKYFKDAIDADPLYALAYAGLAESYALTNLYSGLLDEEAFPRARAAAKRALEIDSELTEAHATLAFVSFYYDWNWERAEQEFRRAIELKPNYATAYQWYGELLYFSGRFDEATAQLKKAAELDPLSPTIKGLQGAPYLWRRDYKRARQEYLKAVEIYPGLSVALYGLAVCYENELSFDKALETYQEEGYRPGQGYALAKMGQEVQAREILNELLQRGPHKQSPYHIAILHIGLGEIDEAFIWLDRARKARDEHMVWLKVEPKLDPLREDPRFLKLLKDVGWTK